MARRVVAAATLLAASVVASAQTVASELDNPESRVAR
jgi:hypothetical protein